MLDVQPFPEVAVEIREGIRIVDLQIVSGRPVFQDAEDDQVLRAPIAHVFVNIRVAHSEPCHLLPQRFVQVEASGHVRAKDHSCTIDGRASHIAGVPTTLELRNER